MEAAEKIAGIKSALFPALEATSENHFVSHDVTDNIMAAIYDLKRTGADKVCISTLEKIEQQLLVAKRIVEAA